MNSESRAELFAEQSLGKDPETVKARLRDSTVVIGIPETLAATRLGQIGLVTATNILCRLGALAPNLYLDVPPEAPVLENVPLLNAGEPLGESLLAMTARLGAIQRGVQERAPATRSATYDHGLFVGRPTVNASQPVVVGSDRWLATVRTDGRRVRINAANPNPLGTVLAAALGAAEVVKRMWLPIRSPSVVIEPITRRATMSAYDLSVNARRPLNPHMPADAELGGHACIFGLGAIGSACLFVLACMPRLNMSLDLVDMDRIEASNEERLFTSAHPETDVGLPKVAHAHQFARQMHGTVRPFAYPMPYERFVNAARDRLGYVLVGLDSIAARRGVQLELPSVVSNGGTEASRWMFSLHEFDRPDGACLLDVYPRPPSTPFDPVRELSERLGIGVELVRQWQQSGKPLQAAVPGAGTRIGAGLVKDPTKRRTLLAMRNLPYVQAVVRVCSTMKPTEAAPAATISFVSLLPATAMIADLVKRRVYGWRPSGDEPNYYQFDALRHPARSMALKLLPGTDCLCRQERYRQAFEKRQDLRRPYLDGTFSSPAVVGGHVQRMPRRPNAARAAARPPAGRRPNRVPVHRRQPGPGPPPDPRPPALNGPLARLCRIKAVLLWISSVSVHLSSLLLTALALGLFVHLEGGSEGRWQFWRLFTMACRTPLDIAHWAKFVGVSFVPVVCYAAAVQVSIRLFLAGASLHWRATGGRVFRNAKEATGALSSIFGLTAAPVFWLGALTASAIVLRSVARLRHSIDACLALLALIFTVTPIAALFFCVPAITMGLAILACKKAVATAW